MKKTSAEIIEYAGGKYQILKKGRYKLKLRSVYDRKLIIKCSSKSPHLHPLEAQNA